VRCFDPMTKTPGRAILLAHAGHSMIPPFCIPIGIVRISYWKSRSAAPVAVRRHQKAYEQQIRAVLRKLPESKPIRTLPAQANVWCLNWLPSWDLASPIGVLILLELFPIWRVVVLLLKLVVSSKRLVCAQLVSSH
jgi:hypothetical protein